MTYAGGKYPSVIGQPPHRRTQYDLLASINRIRASASLAFVSMTTLSGSASRSTARNNFPREQVFQYGFDTAISRDCAPVREVVSGRTKCRSRNTRTRIAVHINDEFLFIFAAPSRRCDDWRRHTSRVLPRCAARGPAVGAHPTPRFRQGHPYSATTAERAGRIPRIIESEHGTAPPGP